VHGAWAVLSLPPAPSLKGGGTRTSHLIESKSEKKAVNLDIP
jgi:hypothetical protein